MEEKYGFNPNFAPNAPALLSYPPNPGSAPENQHHIWGAQNPPLYPPIPSDSPPTYQQGSGNSMFPPSLPPNPQIVTNNEAYRWVDVAATGRIPSTALQGGEDVDGHMIYVGRAFHDGDWIPAKVIPEKNAAYIAYDGEEILVHKYEVLCEQKFDWAPAQGGQIPPGAVQAGITSDQEALYIGRAYHMGSRTIGKVHPSHGACYIPFDGKEIAYPTYEVLVLRY